MKQQLQIRLFPLFTLLFFGKMLLGQNVGIGTITPSQKLDVNGNIVTTGGGNITAAGTISGGSINFSGTETGTINTTGDIFAAGSFLAATIIFSGNETGDILTTGDISATGTLSAGLIDFSGTETGNIATTGSISAGTLSGANIDFSGSETGSIITTGTISAGTIDFSGTETGHITTSGDIETGGTLEAGFDIIAGNHIMATIGDIKTVSGDLITSSGDILTGTGTISGGTIDFGGTETGDISTPGNITAANIIATNSCTCPSDARFKNSIVPLENALKKVLALKGVSYNFDCAQFPERNFSEEKQIGFIAQNMQAVVPELVNEMEDGYLTVDYMKLTPVLVEAIKEQQKVISSLTVEVEQLRTMNKAMAEMEARLAKMEKAIASSNLAEN